MKNKIIISSLKMLITVAIILSMVVNTFAMECEVEDISFGAEETRVIYDTAIENTDEDAEIIEALPASSELSGAEALVDGDYEYLLNEENDKECTITKYNGDGGSIVIPVSFNGIMVTALGDESFQDKKITAVTIPNTVQKIGNKAFESNPFGDEKDNGKLIIPNSVNYIGMNAFANSEFLGEVIFDDSLSPSQNGIEFEVSGSARGEQFKDCIRLKTMKLSNEIRILPAEFAARCTSIQSVDFGSTIEEIGSEAFKGASFGNAKELGEIILPASIKKIGYAAFGDCVLLGKFSIPETTEPLEVEQCIFQNCKYLTYLELPEQLVELSERMLEGTPNLRYVVVKGDKTKIGYKFDFSSGENADKLTVYAKPGSEAEGKAAEEKVATKPVTDVPTEINYPTINKEDVPEILKTTEEPDTPDDNNKLIEVNGGENIVVKQKIDLSSYFAGINGKIKYEVLPKKVGVVKNGVFTAKKECSSEITITAKVNKQTVKTIKLKEKIVKPIAAKGIVKNKKGETISANELFTNVIPKASKWESSKSEVATVDSKIGTVTIADKSGSTKITAYFGEGRNAARYTVTIKTKLPTLVPVKLKIGDIKPIKIKNNSSAVTKWESSDEKVATVDDSGNVNAKASGQSIISATIDGVKYTCIIKVK